MLWLIIGLILGYIIGYHRAKSDIKRALFYLQTVGRQLKERQIP